MLKIDIRINQIVLQLFELVLIKKEESDHQIKYLDDIKTIHLLQKLFLLLTVSHSKDEREFFVTNYLFLSNLSIEYWRFEVVNFVLYESHGFTFSSIIVVFFFLIPIC